jgi:uncharacterized membrane protein
MDAATYHATYLPLAYAHLATVLPAFVIGTYMMIVRKGNALHRALGKVYMVLMLATASISLFMPAVVGARLFDHFGFIHLFSLLTLFAVPSAYFAARRHDVKAHKHNMIGLDLRSCLGGCCIRGCLRSAFVDDGLNG